MNDPIREKTIAREPRTTPVQYFAFNELLAIVDDNGENTGQHAHFVGLEIDQDYNYTNRANVSIIKGPCRMIPLRNLVSLKH